MKVSGTSPGKGIAKTNKKSDSSEKDAAEFGSMVSSGPSEAAAPNNTQSIAQLDALLAVQTVEDPTERQAKQRMKKRSHNILDLLDRIRDKMLSGQLTVGDMIDVADVVVSHREKITDPALTDIMDEVDLRAQVELAKMRIVLDQAKASEKAAE